MGETKTNTFWRSIVSARYSRLVGFVAAMCLFVIFGFALVPVCDKPEDTFAAPTPSTTTLAMTTPSVSLSLALNDAAGTFAVSDPASFSVTTNNYTGYALSIRAKVDDANSTKLVNGNYALNSIAAATADGTGFSVGDWGYKPSKLNSVDNTDFLPAPTYAGNVLNATTTANSTADNYSLALAAKADLSTKSGTYTNTFVLTAVPNVTLYSITYNANTTDSVSNMPSNQIGDTSSAVSITLSSNTPTRSGYSFSGWCDVVPDNSGSCTGNSYAAGDPYDINQTTANNVILYARWAVADSNPIRLAMRNAGKTMRTASDGNDYYQMQDMSSTICNAVTTPTAADYSDTPEAQLVDNRDGKVYWVAKLKDGHCWMTQNLDHDIVTTANFYTPQNTDVMANWTAGRATIDARSGTVTGWTNDYNTPYSVDVGDWYWTDTWFKNDSTVYNYLRNGESDVFKRTAFPGNGAHGHVGNYYNWSAALAMNNTSSYTASTVRDITKNPQSSICPAGWRLPTIFNSSTDSKNEYRYLLNLYNAYPTTGGSRDQLLAAAPLYFIRGGVISSTTVSGSGLYGYYWSSTVSSKDFAYDLYFRDGTLNGLDGSYRYYGTSVRCVAK